MRTAEPLVARGLRLVLRARGHRRGPAPDDRSNLAEDLPLKVYLEHRRAQNAAARLQAFAAHTGRRLPGADWSWPPGPEGEISKVAGFPARPEHHHPYRLLAQIARAQGRKGEGQLSATLQKAGFDLGRRRGVSKNADVDRHLLNCYFAIVP